MAKTIWKFPVQMIDGFDLTMPEGAVILSVQTQQSSPNLWAILDPDQPLEDRTFRLYGTGHTIDKEGLAFIGTFQMYEGAFVGHLFEDTRKING